MKNILLIGMVLLLIGCGSQSNNDYAKLMEENKSESNNSDISQWDNNASNDNYEDEIEPDADQQELDRIQQEEEQQKQNVAGSDLFRIKEAYGEYFSGGMINKTHSIKMTSESNRPINVENVIVNRGNCPIVFEVAPFSLSYGESYTIYTSMNCEVIEIRLVTDIGVIVLNRSNL